MRRKISFISLLVTLCPSITWAHALSPTYYPIGHIPIWLTMEWWPFFLLIPFIITIETVVLWKWFPSIGMYGNLWRAAILFFIEKMVQTAMLYILEIIPLFSHAGWNSSIIETFIPLALLLAVGIFFAIIIALLLYRSTKERICIIVRAVIIASLVSYLSAVGVSLVLNVLQY